jgi:hypothetical protein
MAPFTLALPNAQRARYEILKIIVDDKMTGIAAIIGCKSTL